MKNRRKLKTKPGDSIIILTEKMKNLLGNKRKTRINIGNAKLKKVDEPFSFSTSDDMSNMEIGIDTIRRVMNSGYQKVYTDLLQGEKNVGNIKMNINSYKNIIDGLMRNINWAVRDEYRLRKEIELLPDYSQIAQAARDGVIIKTVSRKEEINGKSKKILYDTPMSPNEVIEILKDYEKKSSNLYYDQISNYLGIGLAAFGTIGSIVKNFKSNEKSNKENKTNINLVSIGTIVLTSLKLFQKNGNGRNEYFDLMDKRRSIINELINNEQISGNAENDSIENVKLVTDDVRKVDSKEKSKRYSFDLAVDIASAILTGAYISNNVTRDEKGKIDGKSLAKVLIELQSKKGILGNFISSLQGFQESKKDKIEFEKICEKVNSIMSQMNEKIYPLNGAKHEFDSFEIKDFNGVFYPKKDYETNSINYSTTIQIPEFSIKRGDVVLLSGESGSGKSTLLRLLKRGDINNRNCITLDNVEKVDNLGNEYISFRPSINLGDETSVLTQITGKSSISSLDDNEKEKLLTIMHELHLDFPNLLNQMASKKYMEFSTGEQRRLALSKLFYRIDDGTSVIIVDEPVGNVQNDLIREQLEMIKNYAESKNVMLILTTHRLDLVDDLITKHYHINSDGVLEEKEVAKKDKKEKDENGDKEII